MIVSVRHVPIKKLKIIVGNIGVLESERSADAIEFSINLTQVVKALANNSSDTSKVPLIISEETISTEPYTRIFLMASSE